MFGIEALAGLVKQAIRDLAAARGRLEGIANTMATRAELDAVKAQLVEAISAAVDRVTADIQALRDKLAAGAVVTDQDLADFQADIQAVGTIDPAV